MSPLNTASSEVLLEKITRGMGVWNKNALGGKRLKNYLAEETSIRHLRALELQCRLQ